MSASVGAIGLRFETPASGRADARRVASELRSALPGAFVAALQARDRGVAVVPRVRVTLRAPLARMRGRDLAAKIAEACAQSIGEQSVVLNCTGVDAGGSAGERLLRMLSAVPGVRTDGAVEAAAWLVALARDEARTFRAVSAFSDLEAWPTAAAFVEICERCNARDVLCALGREWSTAFALRCTRSEAHRLLQSLDDGRDPDASTWIFARAKMRELEAAHAAATGEVRGLPATGEVRGLLATIEGTLSGRAGVAAAVRTLLAVYATGGVASIPASPTAGSSQREALVLEAPDVETPEAVPDASVQSMTSFCTGFWLLLPHLAGRLQRFDDEAARAIAARVAKVLFGECAAEDPAIVAFAAFGERCKAEAIETVRADRLAVAIVRDFARTLFRFERARAGYVLRAMLFGSGTVWQAGRHWRATLPSSPLRIVLERTSPYGGVDAPWREPKLELVRDP